MLSKYDSTTKKNIFEILKFSDYEEENNSSQKKSEFFKKWDYAMTSAPLLFYEGKQVFKYVSYKDTVKTIKNGKVIYDETIPNRKDQVDAVNKKKKWSGVGYPIGTGNHQPVEKNYHEQGLSNRLEITTAGNLNPRSIVIITNKGNLMYMLFSGRLQPGYGSDLATIAELLKLNQTKWDIRHAMQLDGGYSVGGSFRLSGTNCCDHIITAESFNTRPQPIYMHLVNINDVNYYKQSELDMPKKKELTDVEKVKIKQKKIELKKKKEITDVEKIKLKKKKALKDQLKLLQDKNDAIMKKEKDKINKVNNAIKVLEKDIALIKSAIVKQDVDIKITGKIKPKNIMTQNQLKNYLCLNKKKKNWGKKWFEECFFNNGTCQLKDEVPGIFNKCTEWNEFKEKCKNRVLADELYIDALYTKEKIKNELIKRNKVIAIADKSYGIEKKNIDKDFKQKKLDLGDQWPKVELDKIHEVQKKRDAVNEKIKIQKDTDTNLENFYLSLNANLAEKLDKLKNNYFDLLNYIVHIRGSDWMNTVSPKQKKIFKNHLAKNNKNLDKQLEKSINNDAQWHKFFTHIYYQYDNNQKDYKILKDKIQKLFDKVHLQDITKESMFNEGNKSGIKKTLFASMGYLFGLNNYKKNTVDKFEYDTEPYYKNYVYENVFNFENKFWNNLNLYINSNNESGYIDENNRIHCAKFQKDRFDSASGDILEDGKFMYCSDSFNGELEALDKNELLLEFKDITGYPIEKGTFIGVCYRIEATIDGQEKNFWLLKPEKNGKITKYRVIPEKNLTEPTEKQYTEQFNQKGCLIM